MAEPLDTLKVRQRARPRREEFALGHDAVAILVEHGEDLAKDVVRLERVVLIRVGPLARRLVMQAVDRFELL